MAGPTTTGALGAEALFGLVCRLAIADGHLDADEQAALKSLQRYLRIPREKAKEILHRERTGPPDPTAPRLEAGPAFRLACELAWQDGELEPSELELLVGLAQAMKLKAGEAHAILDSVCGAPRPAEADRAFSRDELLRLTPESFAALQAPDRLAAVTGWLRGVHEGRLDPPAWEALLVRAESGRMLEPWLDAFLALLGSTDPRLRLPEGKSQDGAPPPPEADTWAKEQLLFLLRDRLKPASLRLGRLLEAYERESHPMTRMRLVRAAGKIGGPEVLRFLEGIREREGASSTQAAVEAARWLGGKAGGAPRGPPATAAPARSASGPISAAPAPPSLLPAPAPRRPAVAVEAGPGPGRGPSPQGWTDEEPGWPTGGIIRRFFELPSPADAIAALAAAFERALAEETAEPGRVAGRARTEYFQVLRALYLPASEIPRRKGSFGWLAHLLADHLRRGPAIVLAALSGGRLRWLIEDLHDSGDPDLAGAARELQQAIEKTLGRE